MLRENWIPSELPTMLTPTENCEAVKTRDNGVWPAKFWTMNMPIAAGTSFEGAPGDDSLRDLLCLIEGDTVIPVSVVANKPIAILKELIHAKSKGSAFAKDLVLWKVSDILEFSINIYV